MKQRACLRRVTCFSFVPVCTCRRRGRSIVNTDGDWRHFSSSVTLLSLWAVIISAYCNLQRSETNEPDDILVVTPVAGWNIFDWLNVLSPKLIMRQKKVKKKKKKKKKKEKKKNNIYREKTYNFLGFLWVIYTSLSSVSVQQYSTPQLA